jgi:hypothetical protein
VRTSELGYQMPARYLYTTDAANVNIIYWTVSATWGAVLYTHHISGIACNLVPRRLFVTILTGAWCLLIFPRVRKFFEKLLLLSSCQICLSALPQEKPRFPLNRFSWNLVLNHFSNASLENLIFIKNLVKNNRYCKWRPMYSTVHLIYTKTGTKWHMTTKQKERKERS